MRATVGAGLETLVDVAISTGDGALERVHGPGHVVHDGRFDNRRRERCDRVGEVRPNYGKRRIDGERVGERTVDIPARHTKKGKHRERDTPPDGVFQRLHGKFDRVAQGLPT